MNQPRQDPAAIYAEDGQKPEAEAPVKTKKCCEKKSAFQRNTDKYGSKLEEFKLSEVSEFKDGMVMERKRTDTMCAIAFVICIVTWLGIDIFGLTT